MTILELAPAPPLPKLDTMIALCREAREALIDEINSHQELRKDRWRVDRSPCLYALDAQGERLNDGDWCAWTRRKSDVEELLRRHPDAHQIIVDGGIDVAENKELYESSNYEPQFWQATIWKRAEPVYSLDDLETIVRRRTAFTDLRDLLGAKGGYRPSLDMRDAEMAALATFYDQAMERRGDDRRAYRYGTTSITAQDLIGRYKGITARGDVAGEVAHAWMAAGAISAQFEPNTGGGVWLSHAVHRAGAHPLYVCSGCDSVRVYRAPSQDAEACARAIFDLCGEDDHLCVAEHFATADSANELDSDDGIDIDYNEHDEPRGMRP